MSLTVRQKEIVLNIIRIISTQGIQELTIKNIAAAINVTEAAIYRHFKSKNDMLMEVLNYFEELASGMSEKAEQEDTTPLGKIEIFLLQRYELFQSNPDLAKVMFSEVLFENDTDLSNKMHEIIQTHMHQMIEFVHQAQASGQIRKDIDEKHLFRMIVGSMRLLVTQWCLSGYSFPLEEEGKRLWKSVQKLIAGSL